MNFEDQPHLTGETLTLAPMTAEDFEPLYLAASDPGIWAGHPVKDRHKRDVFRPYFDFLLTAGGSLVARDINSKAVIGCSKYYVAPARPDDIAIGFTFLARAYWGGASNFDLKRAMVDHALKSFGSVWFDIDPVNFRSQAATLKIGAVHRYDCEMILAQDPYMWKCYELTARNWAATCAARGAL